MASCSRSVVILLRDPKGANDPYKTVLEEAGFSVYFVKSLQFEYTNARELVLALNSTHGGLIYTSQTAVGATVHAISSMEKDLNLMFEKWANLPVFVTGKATALAVKEFGMTVVGSSSGNAEMLVKEIKNWFSDKDPKHVLPLLFPCGNLARETINVELEKVGFIVNRQICYNTQRDPSIECRIKELHDIGVFSEGCCIVCFSPSGVDYVLPFLRSHGDIKCMKFVAIGPTTAERLRAEGISPSVPLAPKPDALLDVLSQS